MRLEVSDSQARTTQMALTLMVQDGAACLVRRHCGKSKICAAALCRHGEAGQGGAVQRGCDWPGLAHRHGRRAPAAGRRARVAGQHGPHAAVCSTGVC